MKKKLEPHNSYLQDEEWYQAESRACKCLNMEHRGGNRPGPDCVGNDAIVDVKHYKMNIGPSTVSDSIQRRNGWAEEGRHIIASTRSNFTRGARHVARNNDVELLIIGKDKDGIDYVDHVQPSSNLPQETKKKGGWWPW